MKSIQNSRTFNTFLDRNDKVVLSRIIEFCRDRVDLPRIGWYRKQMDEKIWMKLVEQVCVMGGARPLEKLKKDGAQWTLFKAAVSLRRLKRGNQAQEYLARQIRSFKTARFHNKSAERLISMLSNPAIFRNGKLILLDGLSKVEDPHRLRDELICRNPIFRLKSASDFMITVGLSHDVIPLDTRVIGIFKRYFGYNYTPGAVQGRPLLYLSVEETLRQFCREKDIPLALLDRILFNYSGMSLIEFLVGA